MGRWLQAYVQIKRADSICPEVSWVSGQYTLWFWIVLSPDDIVNHFTFIQACKDESDGYYHVEVGLDQKDSNGYVKILCKDRVEVSECLEIFKSFYLDGKIDTEEMYDLKWWAKV